MEQVKAADKLQAPLDLLCSQDGYLLQQNASERSIVHRLEIHLQHRFRSWDVDCEYNRDWHNDQRLHLVDGKLKRVSPDIIVHKRGTSNNLLVIEVKEGSSPNEKDGEDKQRLRRFKSGGTKYKYAVFLKLWTEKNHPRKKISWL